MRDRLGGLRRRAARAVRGTMAFVRRHAFLVAAGAAGVIGAALWAPFGALLSVPVAILGRELERRGGASAERRARRQLALVAQAAAADRLIVGDPLVKIPAGAYTSLRALAGAELAQEVALRDVEMLTVLERMREAIAAEMSPYVADLTPAARTRYVELLETFQRATAATNELRGLYAAVVDAYWKADELASESARAAAGPVYRRLASELQAIVRIADELGLGGA